MAAPFLIRVVAILLQEYMITFGQEVQLFWKSKLTGAAALFFLNRYIVLITMFLNISGVIISAPPEVCRHIFSCLTLCLTIVFEEVRVRYMKSLSIYLIAAA